MNILFLGSSEFSLPFLKTLGGSRHRVSAVVTTPSKPQGRGLKIQPNPAQLFAEEQGLPCFAPGHLKDPDLLESLKKRAPDVLVVASYGKILPPNWIQLPSRFAINVHPSLLPKYRGAAPINWQIIRGETRTGVTIFKIEAGLDSGDVIAQKECPLGREDNAATLSQKLANEGAPLLMKVLETIDAKSIRLVPQNGEEATYAPKLKKGDGLIRWNQAAEDIRNLVRGLIPWPAAHVVFQGEPLKVLEAEAEPVACAEAEPGVILEINKTGFIRVQTGQGALLVERVRPAGKREMTAFEFSIGRRLSPGIFLGG